MGENNGAVPVVQEALPKPVRLRNAIEMGEGIANDRFQEEDVTRHRRSSSRISRPSEPRRAGRKVKGKAVSNEPSTAAAASAQPSAEDEDCQTCKVHYSEDDGRNGAWIGCDGCKGWHHARCVGLEQTMVDKIDKFYCIACEPKHGKSTCEYIPIHLVAVCID